jgi:hypothetical protein
MIISNEDAKKLTERWLKKDETLTLAERVFVLEKMVKRLLLLSKQKEK